jgi:hypothetical protein
VRCADPKLGSGVFIPRFPRNKKTTRQRGARAGGEGRMRSFRVRAISLLSL